MNKRTQFMILLLALTVTFGCKKDKSTVIPLQEVAGYTYFYDLNGIKSTDNSGITVSLEGDTVSTITKSDGSWHFSHLQQGTYTIAFSKPGFGTMKIVGINLIGGYRLLDDIALCPIPLYSTFISNLSANPGNTVHINGDFAGTLPIRPCCHLFFGKTSDVLSDPENYLQDMPICISGSFDCVFTDQILRDAGFKSGDSVYVVAYPDFSVPITYNTWDVAFYYNTNTNVKVYPNLGPNKSNTLSFVLP
jgi:hypothetical protein